MTAGMVRESDLMDWSHGRVKLLPRASGGMLVLVRVGNSTKLTLTGKRGTLESEMTPGEGAAPRTADPVSQ